MYVYIINEKPKSLLEHFLKYEIGDIGISLISICRIAKWFYKSSKINQDLQHFVISYQY